MASGSTPVEPQAPTREGYVFDHWDPAIGAVTQDTNYKAVYRELEKVTVTVRYLKQGTSDTAAADTVVQLKKEGVDTAEVIPPAVVGYAPQQASVTLTATDGVVTASDGLSVEDNVVTVYYGVAEASYTVRYLFEKLDGSGYGTDAAYPDSEPRSAAVNQTVMPVAADYKTVPGFETPSDVVGVVKADNSTVLELKYTRKSGIIVFDMNGGGMQVDAITAKFGEQVSAPAEPERVGYTFLGWFADAAGTEQVTFPLVMDEQGGTLDRTLYAKWQGKMVNYTVIYWVEKPNISSTPDMSTPTAYNFYSQTTRQAIAGGPASETSGDRGATFTAKQINGTTDTNSSVKVAEYQGSKPIESVNGDGTSVLNVYYKRKTFTLIFNADGNGNGFAFDSAPNTVYANSEYSIPVKYEQDVSSIWPSSHNATFKTREWIGNYYGYWGSWSNRGDDNNFAGWGSYLTHRWIVTSDMLPENGNSRTYTASYKSIKKVQVNYWVEGIPGDTMPEQYSGTVQGTYWLHYATQALNRAKSDSLNSKNLDGFINPNTSGGKQDEYNFYYARRKYTFAYDPQTSAYSGGTILNVPYEKSLKLVFPAYASEWDGRTITVDGVVKRFDGWYYEPECRTPVDFSSDRMPAKNLTIYAKWSKQQVTLSFDAASAGQSFEDITYDAGDVVEDLPVLPDKQNEAFAGWYSDPETTQKFTDGMVISRDTTLYAGWKPFATQYTVRYVDLNNNPISTAKVVSGVRVGDIITAGDTGSETEQPVYVNGYAFDSVQPAELTLGKDKASNTIVFKYKAFSGYHYTVKYLLENGDPIPGVSDVLRDTADARVIEYYKPITGYYPLTYIEKLDLSASDPESNVITFYYRAYQTALITVEHYKQLDNGDYPTTPDNVDEAVSRRVGNTFTAEQRTYEGYEFDHAVESERYTVTTASPSTLTIKLYYCKKKYTIETSVTNGTIDPDADPTVEHGGSQLVTYAPATGYHLKSVTVDGTDVTEAYPASYTFTNVTEDHTISVVYEVNVYTITYKINGTEYASYGESAVAYGTEKEVRGAPEESAVAEPATACRSSIPA